QQSAVGIMGVMAGLVQTRSGHPRFFLRKDVDARDKRGMAGVLLRSSRAQARQQLGGGPAVGRHAEFDLHVSDRYPALQAKHAIHPADVVAALFQNLLQLACLLESDFWNRSASLRHWRRAVEPGGVI